MAESELILYGTDWCGDCRRTRRFLDEHHVLYRWVNIDGDRDAEALVVRVNRGRRSVPTLVFPDGSLLVEPSTSELAQRIGVGARGG